MVRDRGSVRRARSTAATAAALCAALLVAGACSGPSPTPKPLGKSTKVSSTPTQSATATPKPSASATPSEAPAQTFIRTFVDAVNIGIKTGNVTRMRSLSEPNCSDCSYMADSYSKFIKGGGSFLDDPTYKVEGFASMPEGSNPITVTMYLSSGKVRYREKAGGPIKTSKAEPTMLFKVELVPTGSSWKVKRFYEWQG